MFSPADVRSDARLIRGFVDERDDRAFAEIVRRYGGLVRAVCRRTVRNPSDADDAFQATFLVLARDAAGIAEPAALPGWLHRTAYLTAKRMRERGLQVPSVARNTPATGPDDRAAARELGALLDAEIARLSDPLRTAFVLCVIEGRTRAEAAAVLGCPPGTVDSRLAAARDRLKRRLVGRGIAPAVLAGLVLAAGDTAGVGPALVRQTVSAALAYCSGSSGGGPDGIVLLANEVRPMASVSPSKLWALVAAAALLTTGVGVMFAREGGELDRPSPAAPAVARPAAARTLAPARPGVHADSPPLVSASPGFAKVAAVLESQVELETPLDGLSLKALIDTLRDKTRTPIRFDLAACVRCGVAPDSVSLSELFERKFRIVEAARNMKVRDLLDFALADLTRDEGKLFTVRPTANGILIGPAFQMLPKTAQQREEQVLGPPVTMVVQGVKFSEVARDLAEQSGWDVVFAAPAALDVPVSTYSVDCRLLHCLQKLAFQAGLKVVAVGNGFVVTTEEKAKVLESVKK